VSIEIGECLRATFFTYFPVRTLFIVEMADGGRGRGDNVLTITMRTEHDRTGGHRGEFGSYGAPGDTR
jgi:hypothetical protein